MSERRRKRPYVILPVEAVDPVAQDPRQSAPPERGRHELIATAAYARAARRGFRDGDPLADWLAAEAEVDAMLAGGERD